MKPLRCTLIFWCFLVVLLITSLNLTGCASLNQVAPETLPPEANPSTQAGPPVNLEVTPEIYPTTIPSPPPLQPAIPEARRLILEWPPSIRVGDSDTIRLSLEMDNNGKLTPTAEIAGHETYGENVEVPNLYDTHHVLAEARLDMAGLDVSPNGLSSQTLLPGRTVTFYWSISPDRASTFRGTIWFYLRFVPLQGGMESQLPISAQRIEIRGVDFLGLNGRPARILGGIGALVGSVISLDNIISWLWNVFKRRMGRKG